jgi:Co/Zn/Cd efflux system component
MPCAFWVVCSSHEKSWGIKEWSFAIIGIVTFLYVIFELVVALKLGSLTLLSDGFHNLSDVLALYIAFWASKVCCIDANIHTKAARFARYTLCLAAHRLTG